MTKQSNQRIEAAKERLRKIERLLGPYKKEEPVEPYSSRGKWRSAREINGDPREQGFDETMADSN